MRIGIQVFNDKEGNTNSVTLRFIEDRKELANKKGEVVWKPRVAQFTVYDFEKVKGSNVSILNNDASGMGRVGHDIDDLLMTQSSTVREALYWALTGQEK